MHQITLGYRFSMWRILLWKVRCIYRTDNVFSISTVPSNLLLKRFGATLWRAWLLATLTCILSILVVSSLVLAFGAICFCTAFMRNFAQFMVIRILLGITEGGMMPGIAYYLSTWYKKDELALRMGIFGGYSLQRKAFSIWQIPAVSAASMSGAFGGLLATGFLSIPQLSGLWVAAQRYFPSITHLSLGRPGVGEISFYSKERLPFWLHSSATNFYQDHQEPQIF